MTTPSRLPNDQTTTEDLIQTMTNPRNGFLAVLASRVFERRTGQSAEKYAPIPAVATIEFVLDGKPAYASLCIPSQPLRYKGGVTRHKTFQCARLGGDETPYLVLVETGADRQFDDVMDLDGDVLDFDPENCHLLLVPRRDEIPVEVLQAVHELVENCQ